MTGRGNTSQGSDAATEIATAAIEHLTVDANPARVKDARVGTTHDVHGGDDPRLVANFEDSFELNIELADRRFSRCFAETRNHRGGQRPRVRHRSAEGRRTASRDRP